MIRRTAVIGLLFIFMAGIALAVECADPNSEPAEQDKGKICTKKIPKMSEPVIVVPSAGLPAQIEDQNANNNLDVARHEGKVFFVFRTAPTHFASPKATLYVVSSQDQEKWDFEAKFNLDTDLREPRFLSWNGKLFLYFAVLGATSMDFTPKGMMVSEYIGPGQWTEPEWFYDKGFIPWRVKVIDNVPYMLTYRGGEKLYDFAEASSEELFWLTTRDGKNWEAVVPGKPMIYKGGCSETDFVFTDDGALVAVCRNELGDKDGFGSKICRAEPNALGDWKCNPDPKKYDSPLVFKSGSEIYLIGRRNISRTGAYDLGYNNMSFQARASSYQIDYWKRPKRCSLWSVNPDTLEVTFIKDLPSRGDTCFASIIPMSDNQYMVYNYTSPLDGPDPSWNQGQQGKTFIYKMLLTFEE